MNAPFATLSPDTRAAAIWLALFGGRECNVATVNDAFPGAVATLIAAGLARAERGGSSYVDAVRLTDAARVAVARWLAFTPPVAAGAEVER